MAVMFPSKQSILAAIDTSDLTSVRRVMAAIAYNFTHIVLNPRDPKITKLTKVESSVVSLICASCRRNAIEFPMLLYATLQFALGQDEHESDEIIRDVVSKYVQVAPANVLLFPKAYSEEYERFAAIYYHPTTGLGCASITRSHFDISAPAALSYSQIFSTKRAVQLEILAKTNHHGRTIDIPTEVALGPIQQGQPLDQNVEPTRNTGPCMNCKRRGRNCNMEEPFCLECRLGWDCSCSYDTPSAGTVSQIMQGLDEYHRQQEEIRVARERDEEAIQAEGLAMERERQAEEMEGEQIVALQHIITQGNVGLDLVAKKEVANTAERIYVSPYNNDGSFNQQSQSSAETGQGSQPLHQASVGELAAEPPNVSNGYLSDSDATLTPYPSDLEDPFSPGTMPWHESYVVPLSQSRVIVDDEAATQQVTTGIIRRGNCGNGNVSPAGVNLGCLRCTSMKSNVAVIVPVQDWNSAL